MLLQAGAAQRSAARDAAAHAPAPAEGSTRAAQRPFAGPATGRMGVAFSSSRSIGRSVAACAASSTQAAVDVTVAEPQCARGFTYAAFEANAWQAKFAKSGVTILVDPWLVGELTFFGQDWAFVGRKGQLPAVDVAAVAAKTDLLVLTQALPDHAHTPTLEVLPKELPVVCSPAAARVAAELGFKNVYELDHGRGMDFCDGRLHVRATAGALVGPPWSKRENGFVFRETAAEGVSLYYEPHCDYLPDSLEGVGPVDAVITPVVDQLLVGYPLVMGGRNVSGLLRQLQPAAIVPLINAGFPSEGPLSKIISEKGSAQQLEGKLRGEGLATRVQMPAAPGKSIEVAL